MRTIQQSNEPSIVFVDERFALAYKPAGMHCAPPSASSDARGEEPCLLDWLLERYPQARGVRGRGKGESGLVHRLDRDTRGLVLFALDDEAFAHIARCADRGEFRKGYRVLAAADGSGLDGSRPTLLAPGGTEERDWRRASPTRRAELAAEVLTGRVISSRFRPFGPGARRVACALADDPVALKASKGGGKDWTKAVYGTTVQSCRAESGFLRAEVELCRGFRHQIRAHFAWLGLPLFADRLYGESDDSEFGAQTAIMARDDAADAPDASDAPDLAPDGPSASGKELGLCAFALSFPDPKGGPLLRFTLDLEP